MTPRIIGWSGTYVGATYPDLRDRRVCFVGVRKSLPPPEEPIRIVSNDELAALGGLAADDRIDIAFVVENGLPAHVVRDLPLDDLDNAFWMLHPPPPSSHEG